VRHVRNIQQYEVEGAWMEVTSTGQYLCLEFYPFLFLFSLFAKVHLSIFIYLGFDVNDIFYLLLGEYDRDK